MQAIRTHYLPATNYKPSRIKAACDRGSVTVGYDSTESNEAAHAYAVRTLLNRFIAEDEKKYGSVSRWGGFGALIHSRLWSEQ